MSLVEKMRKARQLQVPVGKFTFTVRRPTDEEAATLKSMTLFDVCKRFTDGWDKVTEMDLIPGGSSAAVEFSKAVWEEWIADRPDFWTPISKAVLDAYRSYRKNQDEAAKN